MASDSWSSSDRSAVADSAGGGAILERAFSCMAPGVVMTAVELGSTPRGTRP